MKPSPAGGTLVLEPRSLNTVMHEHYQVSHLLALQLILVSLVFIVREELGVRVRLAASLLSSRSWDPPVTGGYCGCGLLTWSHPWSLDHLPVWKDV